MHAHAHHCRGIAPRCSLRAGARSGRGDRVAAGAAEVTFVLRIENGRVPENMRRIRVKQNDVVKLQWSTDRPHGLHLHGYDIETEVRAGRGQRDDVHRPRHRPVHGRAAPARPPAATAWETSLSPSRSSPPSGARGRRCRQLRGCAQHCLATPATAHGFGQRYDLPIPLSLLSVRRPPPSLRLVPHRRHCSCARERARTHRLAVDLLATRSDASLASPALVLALKLARARRLHRHHPRGACAATRIPTGTSRRPWCGSSGGSASPMSRPLSEICGR